MKLHSVVICALLFLAGNPAHSEGQLEDATVQVGPNQRSYAFYVPTANAPGQPLVIALHGLLGSGSAMRAGTQFALDRLADQHGFVVAYPNAMYGSWHDCRKDASTLAHTEKVDDVGFLKAVVEAAVARYRTDSRKVYLFGFSAGGHMAMRMAWEAPQAIAAVAVVAAGLPTSLSCAPAGNTPRIMFVNGTADSTIPYQGGKTASGVTVFSAADTAAAFAKANGLAQPDAEVELPALSGEPGAARLLAWRRDGRPIVALYTVLEGAHRIPLASQGRFDAPSTAWKFFSAD